MTTTFHVVNFGPQAIKVCTVNPTTNTAQYPDEVLFCQQSVNRYVHEGQVIKIEEVKE